MALDRRFVLTSSELDPLSLRSIDVSDLENLRRWKNANRFAFFSQELISPEGQARWFDGYRARPDDWMFTVRVAEQPIGCMGFRRLGAAVDIYNVILGDPAMGRRGWMRGGLRLLCSYVASRHTRAIGVQVLRSNPAVHWYEKLGFGEVAGHETFLDLALNFERFQPCSFVEHDPVQGA